MTNDRIRLTCDGCDTGKRATPAQFKDMGWRWQEAVITDNIRVRAAECPDCNVNVPQLLDARQQEAEGFFDPDPPRPETQLDTFIPG